MNKLELKPGMLVLRQKNMRVWLIDEDIKPTGYVAINPDNHDDFTVIKLGEGVKEVSIITEN